MTNRERAEKYVPTVAPFDLDSPAYRDRAMGWMVDRAIRVERLVEEFDEVDREG